MSFFKKIFGKEGEDNIPQLVEQAEAAIVRGNLDEGIALFRKTLKLDSSLSNKILDPQQNLWVSCERLLGLACIVAFQFSMVAGLSLFFSYAITQA